MRHGRAGGSTWEHWTRWRSCCGRWEADMPDTALIGKLEELLADVPMLDAHTHLVGGRLGARGLHDILLYHMAISDLYAAGCPSGSRLTCYPDWPSVDEAHGRIK